MIGMAKSIVNMAGITNTFIRALRKKEAACFLHLYIFVYLDLCHVELYFYVYICAYRIVLDYILHIILCCVKKIQDCS